MTTEVETFASSVRQLVGTINSSDSWRPGAHIDSQDPALTAGLHDLGWGDLVGDTDFLPFVGAAALELGRAALTPFDVTGLLGGSPVVSGLAMHGAVGSAVAVPEKNGYQLKTITASSPVNFSDSLGVHLVEATTDQEFIEDGDLRRAAWEAAVVGYFAGLAIGAVDMAISHAAERQIFGKTLAHVPAVQQRIADAATTATALRLSAASGAHGIAAIAYASSRTWAVMAHCHLVFGAIGYTLEFPLQRYARHTKALSTFVNGWVDQQILIEA
ncbi:acyl-CoA dehydrogenase family protein [Pseudarthrobacter sp. SSS035]|uniref:acyl-CoA dehydrogenase family protein n=1 Tax=Pseudarthrobacter sp. SSS035 TaxID=2931399 RepID=UPI00200DBF24|nr:acyl-CoA dehydrogenase family protein [Pseudarthrobacter sp. SSS035]